MLFCQGTQLRLARDVLLTAALMIKHYIIELVMVRQITQHRQHRGDTTACRKQQQRLWRGGIQMEMPSRMLRGQGRANLQILLQPIRNSPAINTLDRNR
ncbi:Uncharacterised protein [Vibrio cholerae]|uniref:Uncharacterized protein n=1 Tax=Vibrio cholerae TaxID=666 RepID=A0A655YX61_VIBCL|nr:Uncharacterised protein [Vibrio cholerae]